MTDLPAAIAAARDALAKRDELAHRGNRLRAEERANWECAQHLRVLLAALDAQVPVAWPKADDSARAIGWTWDYKWIESLADATRAAGWDASMESIDFLLSRLAAQQPAAVVPEPMPPVPDSMGLSREQREVEDAFRRGWNSCRARVMQLNAYALAVRNKENNNE